MNNTYLPSDYRKIYEQHHGPIPVDASGRTYEIHHLDGNNKNNAISNLIAVSIDEHYAIHLAQGDHGACSAMAVRLKLSPEEIAEHSRQSAYKQVANGRHPFVGGNIQREAYKNRRKLGIDNSQKLWTCPHCNTSGYSKMNYTKHHGENCGKNSVVINNITYSSINQAMKKLGLSRYLVRKLLKTA